MSEASLSSPTDDHSDLTPEGASLRLTRGHGLDGPGGLPTRPPVVRGADEGSVCRLLGLVRDERRATFAASLLTVRRDRTLGWSPPTVPASVGFREEKVHPSQERRGEGEEQGHCKGRDVWGGCPKGVRVTPEGSLVLSLNP